MPHNPPQAKEVSRRRTGWFPAKRLEEKNPAPPDGRTGKHSPIIPRGPILWEERRPFMQTR